VLANTYLNSGLYVPKILIIVYIVCTVTFVLSKEGNMPNSRGGLYNKNNIKKKFLLIASVVIMNLNNTQIHIKITTLHQQSVNIIYQIPNLNGGFRLSGRLIIVIDLQLKKLYL
jgi:hypothetical protein